MLTGAQVAERLGINPSRVRQIAIELSLGTMVTSRMRLFSEEEVAIMEARKTKPGPIAEGEIIRWHCPYPSPETKHLPYAQQKRCPGILSGPYHETAATRSVCPVCGVSTASRPANTEAGKAYQDEIAAQAR